MAKSLTLEQVKEAKKNLELELVKLFKDFESSTQLRIRYSNIKRKKPKKMDKMADEEVMSWEERERQPIVDVQLDVDLDLLF